MNNDIKKRNFITQGSILALTGIVCRLIGMLYRIPLIQIIGTEGNGYYTSAYSIYNILLILSSYSLPTAISKVISVRLARERYEDVKNVFRVAFVYATLIGAVMCSIMFFGAAPIAEFMEKPFCQYALRTLAPTIWIMAYLGILRGYFQGTGNMVPTAISQVLEQIINAAVSIIMALLLFDYGAKANLLYDSTEYSYAYGAAGGTIGTGAGALIALLFFILLMLLYGKLPEEKLMTHVADDENKSGQSRSRRIARTRRKEPVGHIAAVLILTILPILISSTVYNISTVLDDFIFSRVMATIGYAESVVFLWGIFGEYRILFNIPVAMANSISSSVIPSLTNAVADKDKKLIVQKIKLSIQFVMIISMPAAAGLFFLAQPICNLLFAGKNNAMLVNVLRVGCPAIVLFAESTITNGILQGLGYLSAPLKNAFLALIVHVIALMALLFVMPNIYSVILANTIFAFIVCLLNSYVTHSHVHYRLRAYKTYAAPFIAAMVMGIVVYGISMFLLNIFPDSISGGRLGLTFTVCVCIIIAIPVYFALLVWLKAFTKSELLEMPMGARIYRFLRRLSLM